MHVKIITLITQWKKFSLCTFQETESHLLCATCEHSYYSKVVKECKEALQKHFTTDHNWAFSSQSCNEVPFSHSGNEGLPSKSSNEALSSLTDTKALSSPFRSVFCSPPAGSAVASGSGPVCIHYSFDLLSRFTILTTPFNNVQCISRLNRSAEFFGSALKVCPGRSTTW